MVVCTGKTRVKADFTRCEATRWSCGYSLTRIYGKEIQDIGLKYYSMPPVEAYIRTTPDDGDWLIFRFSGYNSEGRMRILLDPEQE